MALSGAQIRHLRGLAHTLEATIRIGANGVTEGVLSQIEEQLEARELIKLRLLDAEQDDVEEARRAILEGTHAEIVQTIGHTLVLYRRRRDKNKPPAVLLPKAR